MPKIDKYFERKYTKWNIIDFLNECNIETFEGKIDHYLKSLRAIVDCERGANQDKARYLLDRYNKVSKNPFLYVKNSGVTGTSSVLVIQGSLLSHKTSAGAHMTSSVV
jgi:hypothetical protein